MFHNFIERTHSKPFKCDSCQNRIGLHLSAAIFHLAAPSFVSCLCIFFSLVRKL